MRLIRPTFALLLTSTACQFAQLAPLPDHPVTVTAVGLWNGADVDLRLTAQGFEPQSLKVTGEGTLTFGTELDEGTAFTVELTRSDAHHECTLSGGSGVSSADGAAVVLQCISNIELTIETTVLGTTIDPQRTEQAFDVSLLQQSIAVRAMGAPGTLVQVQGIPVALGTTSPVTALSAGPNQVSVRIEVSGLSRTYDLTFDRGATFPAQHAYVKAPNLDAADRFGVAVAGTDDYIVVGSPMEDGAGYHVNPPDDDNRMDSGAVYVYRRTSRGYEFEAYIKPPIDQADTRAGYSIAASGSLLAMGVPRSNDYGVSAGSVYLYRRSAGGQWLFEKVLRSSDPSPGDEFGSAVAIDGDTVAISARAEDDGSTTNQGAVYVFRRIDGVWQEEQTLRSPNPTTNDYCGSQGGSLAVEGLFLAVGCSSEDSYTRGVSTTVPADDNSLESGAVFVYKYGPQGWMLDAYLKSSNSDAYDKFGYATALEGNRLVVGAAGESSSGTDPFDNSVLKAGAVYVFERGASWTQTAMLKAPVAELNAEVGGAVTVAGDLIATGGFSGPAYLLHYQAGAWSHVGPPLNATVPDPGDAFGSGVVLVPNGLASTAPFDDGTDAPGSGGALNSGAAYIFR